MDKYLKLLGWTPLWLMMLLGISGCTGGMYGLSAIQNKIPKDWQADIRELVRLQESAVLSGSSGDYMQTIDARDPYYWQEQQHWFSDAANFVRGKKYRRTVCAFLKREGNDEVVALVEQQIGNGERELGVRVPIRFRRTPEGWKDADLPFLETRGSRTVVKVTHPRLIPLAEELANVSDDAQKRLSTLYGWKAQQPVTLKLYGKKGWFLQSVKWSLPDWAGGWNEYGESIKLLVDEHIGISEAAKRFYHSAIIHEMVHKMLGELTHDNAAYWLHEGLAEQTSALWDQIQENDALPAIPRSERWSWPALAAINPEELPAAKAVRYYQQSRLVTAFLLERYGYEAMREVFASLQQQPYIPASTAEKLEEVNRRTVHALERVLGKSFQQLAEEWWRWVPR